MRKRIFILSIVVISTILLSNNPLFAGTAALSWNPNTESDLAGYKAYYGTVSGSYTQSIDVGNVTSYTINGLVDGVTYYFAIKAYDTAGNESGFSNEVSKTIPISTFTLTVTKSGTGSGTVTSSPAGINCGTTCSASYNSGTVVTLTATPASGSVFAGWTGDADCSDASVTMTASKTCTATFNPAPDITPPVISGIATSNLTGNSVTISWTTDELADTQVEYGVTTNYGSFTTLQTSLVSSHSQNLIGLSSATSYHYRARSRDAAGNLAVSTDRTFTTLTVNLPPTANAGPDQTVWANSLVILDGSGSTDPEGALLTYTWTQTTGPTVQLSNSMAMQPSFTPTSTGTYGFSLTVSDGVNLSQPDTVLITVNAPANTVPTANAGPDQTVLAGSLVTLDGSQSVDPDGDPLTFLWTQVNGPSISLVNPASARPSFTPNLAGVYQFSLIVSDGKANSSPDTVNITVNSVNSVPTANAGPDQTVNTGELVTLNGAQSSDADGDPLTYHWTQTGGSVVVLSDTTSINPTFIPTSAGVLVFSLVVNDGKVDSLPDSVTITVNQPNSVPIANAGSDLTSLVGQTDMLDGSASYDPDGDPLRFAWSQTRGPSVVLSNPSSAKPTFIPMVAAIYAFQLIVSDGQVQSSPDPVQITINGVNTIPIANAGPDQIVETGKLVTLDGSLSYDNDSDSLTYTWTQREGTNITLQGANTLHPQFYPVDNKTYAFDLVVNDGISSSAPDQVKIYVIDRLFITQVISSQSGGTLSITNGNLAGLQMTIPPQALTVDTLIGIGQNLNLPSLKGRKFIQIPAGFEPAGFVFNKPVSVTIPYDANRYKNTVNLKAYLYDETAGQWIEVPIISIDKDHGLLTVNINHFSSLVLTDDEEQAASNSGKSGPSFGCGHIDISGKGNGPVPPNQAVLNFMLYASLFLALKMLRRFGKRFRLNV